MLILVQIDIWSMGVCVLELANHEPPNCESPYRVREIFFLHL
jgi:serine/threonine protein kinase